MGISPLAVSASSVSVVIPTYNRAGVLGEAVTSALHQTAAPLEVVVVDDGSTDDTPSVCRRYPVVYRRIDNSGGPARPRNVGIRVARGSVIAFLDADDVWLPHKLEAQVAKLQHPDVGLVYADMEIWEEGRRHEETFFAQATPREGDVLVPLLAGNFVPTSTVLVRRRLVEEVGGFDEHPELHGVEDYHLWLRLAARSVRFAFVPHPLARYREVHGSLGDMNPQDALEKVLRVFSSLPTVPGALESLVRWRKFVTMMALARTATPISAKTRYYWRALRVCPYGRLLRRLMDRAHA